MRITRLKLQGFKRIALTGYRNIDIRFDKKIQLILGMNSCGKSSLMRELSPLPTPGQHLDSGGFKEIWIEHNGVSYYLKNSKDGKCVFLNELSGEDLNPGGTQAVQKEMIKQVFLYDAKIHDLLTGVETFTEMKPARRKDWITQLSDVDYDYALKVFQAFKEAWRDRQGAYKLSSNKLLEVSEQAVPPAIMEKQQDKIRQIESLINELNGLRDNQAETAPERVDLLLSNLKSEAQRLMRFYLTHYEVLRIEDSYLDKLKAQLPILERQRDEMMQVLNQRREEYEQAMSLSSRSVESFQYDIQKHREEMNALSNRMNLKLTFPYPKESLHTFENIKGELLEALMQLPGNESGFYSKETLRQLQEEDARLVVKRGNLEQRKHQASAELKHLKEQHGQGLITCPKCHYQHNPHVDEQSIQRLEKELVKIGEWEGLLENKENDLRRNLSEHIDYFGRYTAVLAVVRNTPSLKPFWDLLASEKTISRYPRQTITLLRQLQEDLQLAVRLDEMREEERGLLEQLKGKEAVANVSVTQLKEWLEREEVRLADVLNEIIETKQILDELQTKLKLRDELLDDIMKLQKELSHLERVGQETLRHLQQKHLMEYIRKLQEVLGEEVRLLHDYQNSRNRITDLENQLNVLREEGELLKVLTQVISPTEGLIAKGLMSFIGHMVMLMNDLINKVWTYNMQIVVPQWNEEGGSELDYRFAFIMKDDNNKVADVSLGSRGQQEIINLAFRVVAALFLKLEDIPIFADEFGTGLDETHRRKAAEVMKNITSEKMYSQLFMISHYSDAHGALTNAEVCVLSEENITVPAQYNEHVVFS